MQVMPEAMEVYGELSSVVQLNRIANFPDSRRKFPQIAHQRYWPFMHGAVLLPRE